MFTRRNSGPMGRTVWVERIECFTETNQLRRSTATTPNLIDVAGNFRPRGNGRWLRSRGKIANNLSFDCSVYPPSISVLKAEFPDAHNALHSPSIDRPDLNLTCSCRYTEGTPLEVSTDQSWFASSGLRAKFRRSNEVKTPAY